MRLLLAKIAIALLLIPIIGIGGLSIIGKYLHKWSETAIDFIDDLIIKIRIWEG